MSASSEKAERARPPRRRGAEDEICFFRFAAASAHVVERVAQRAGLEPLRIVEAIASGKEIP